MDLSIDGIESKCYGCRGEASTYVFMSDGLRRYLCQGCVSEIFRHETEAEDIEDQPKVVSCPGCGKFTLLKYAPANICPECRSDDTQQAKEIVSQIDETSREYAETADDLGSNDTISVVEDEDE